MGNCISLRCTTKKIKPINSPFENKLKKNEKETQDEKILNMNETVNKENKVIN